MQELLLDACVHTQPHCCVCTSKVHPVDLEVLHTGDLGCQVQKRRSGWLELGIRTQQPSPRLGRGSSQPPASFASVCDLLTSLATPSSSATPCASSSAVSTSFTCWWGAAWAEVMRLLCRVVCVSDGVSDHIAHTPQSQPRVYVACDTLWPSLIG